MIEQTIKRPIEWVCGACTDVGVVRKINEDALLARPEVGLWAVADGMGGHHVGDVASRMIVDALDRLQPSRRLADFVDDVEQCLLDVNREILDYSDLMFDSATMGSTLVSLLIRGRVGACLWAGDSRLYRVRNHQLTQLTSDHSHVQELIECGVLTPEEAEGHPQGNIITRAVGVDEQGFVDLNVFNTQIGDVFLLCSDGLHNTVSHEQILRLLSLPDCQQAAHELLNAALQNGAPDNVSAVVVRGEPGKFPD